MARSCLAITLVVLGAVAASAAVTPFSIESLKTALKDRQAGVASAPYAQYREYSPKYDARGPRYGPDAYHGKPEEKPYYGKHEEKPYHGRHEEEKPYYGKPEERPYHGEHEEKHEYGYEAESYKSEHTKTVWLQEFKQEEIDMGDSETVIAYRSSFRCSTDDDDKCEAPKSYEKPEYGYGEGGFKKYLGSLDVASATCTWVQLNETCPTDAIKHIGSGSCIPAKATCYFTKQSEQCGEPLCQGLTITAKGIFFVIEATSCEEEYPAKEGSGDKKAPAPAPVPVPVPVPEPAPSSYYGEEKEEEPSIYKGEAALFVGHIVHCSDPHHEWNKDGKLEFIPSFQGELVKSTNMKSGLKGAVKSDNLPFVKGGALKVTFSDKGY